MTSTTSRFLCAGIALLLASGACRAADTASGANTCDFDRARQLALDLEGFDQGDEGLQAAAKAHPGCELPLAGLIADYRWMHPDVLKNPNAYLLFWHEGQFRASAGQSPQAAALFDRTRLSGGPVDRMWNIYVDASIAFVRRDRQALHDARAALAAVPPAIYAPDRQPLNLDVVDGLLRCFDKSYDDAYARECRAATPARTN